MSDLIARMLKGILNTLLALPSIRANSLQLRMTGPILFQPLKHSHVYRHLCAGEPVQCTVVRGARCAVRARSGRDCTTVSLSTRAVTVKASTAHNCTDSGCDADVPITTDIDNCAFCIDYSKSKIELLSSGLVVIKKCGLEEPIQTLKLGDMVLKSRGGIALAFLLFYMILFYGFFALTLPLLKVSSDRTPTRCLSQTVSVKINQIGKLLT